MKKKFKLSLMIALLIALCGCNAGKTSQSGEEIPTDRSSAMPMKEINFTQYAAIHNKAKTQRAEPNSVDDSDDLDYYDFESKDFPLYAKLESDNIYLYGVHPYGMILYQNRRATYFDWPGITPRQIFPELSYYDYDGDGQKELAVTIYWGSGTAFSMMDLHILEITQHDGSFEKPEYTDNGLYSGEVEEWFTEPITATLTPDNKKITVNFDGHEYIPDYDITELGNFTGIRLGGIVNFKFDQSRIKAEIGIDTELDHCATGVYIGTIEAIVNYKDNQFSLSDYKFITD